MRLLVITINKLNGNDQSQAQLNKAGHCKIIELISLSSATKKLKYKYIDSISMKKNERKVLKVKLLTAINKVLKDNKDDLKNKTKIAIKKSIKQIVKNTDKKKKSVSAKRILSKKKKNDA